MRSIPKTITEHPGLNDQSPDAWKDAKRASRDRHFGLPVRKIIDGQTLQGAIDDLSAKIGLKPIEPEPELYFVRWTAPDGAEETLTVHVENLVALFDDLRADGVNLITVESV